MINRIYSSLPRFKELKFKKGLNILLSDRHETATDRQTRNRAGKTSLIELIHFLTGAKVNKDSIFRTKELSPHTFGMEFSLSNNWINVERAGEVPNRVVVAGNTDLWPIPPTRYKETGELVISNSNWRKVLGHFIFGLVEDLSETEKYRPTFRSLFPYFVRRQNSGGFVSPTKSGYKQQPWDEQVSISFLLGLDWTIAQQWQFVRDKEKTLKELRKAQGDGVLGSFIGNTATLLTKVTVTEEKVRQMKEELRSFRVLNEYRDLETEASEITRKINSLANENTTDREYIAELENALTSETAPSFTDVENLYKEAGVVLPETVLRRIDEVKEFHRIVVENRKSYLTEEHGDAEQRIFSRQKSIEKLTNRRAEILQILNLHGALDQYNQLQSELAKIESQLESLRHQYFIAQQLEEGKAQLDMARRKLEVRLRQDYSEQYEILRRAILTFEQISGDLYENAGSLIVKPTTNGPHFEISIQGSKSKGISNMQIFCFDIMLMSLCDERKIGPGFLVHDSHIFDGVDDRQIAKALEIGARLAAEHDFQYIITMNSDVLPEVLPSGTKTKEYVLPVRLTDELEDGGLFGLRF